MLYGRLCKSIFQTSLHLIKKSEKSLNCFAGRREERRKLKRWRRRFACRSCIRDISLISAFGTRTFFIRAMPKIFCRVKGAFFHSLAWYLEHRFQFLAGAHHCSLLFHLVKKCWGFKLVTEIYTHRSSSAQSNKLSSLGIETSPVAVQSRSFIWKKNKQISK